MPKKTKAGVEKSNEESSQAVTEAAEEPVVAEKKTAKKKRQQTEAEDVDVQQPAKDAKEKKSSKKRVRSASDASDREAAEEIPVCLPVDDSKPLKAKKPLPPGYVCKACGGSGHAIYDCPSKIPAKSSSTAVAEAKQPSKPQKEVNPKAATNDINLHKMYVSGLPYEMTNEKMKDFFEEKGCEVKQVSLIMFEDNKSKCKGYGFVTFVDEANASAAAALSGQDMGRKSLAVVPCVDKDGGDNKKSGDKEKEKRPLKKARTPKCYRCGESHDPATCTNQRICYRCRSSTHISSNCPLKKTASK